MKRLIQVELTFIILVVLLSSFTLGYGGRSQVNEFTRSNTLFGPRDVSNTNGENPVETPINTSEVTQVTQYELIQENNTSNQTMTEIEEPEDNSDILLFGMLFVICFIIIIWFIIIQRERVL